MNQQQAFSLSPSSIISGIELPDIEAAWEESMRSKIKRQPMNNLRASSIGHPCDRYHYHSIKDWRERPLHGVDLQGIFEEGELHEQATIRKVTTLSYKGEPLTVIEQQIPLQIDHPLITGHIDGKVIWKGHQFPCDVKSMDNFVFMKMRSAEDFLYSAKLYHQHYVAQLQMYLYQTGQEVGCLLLKNKTTGRLRPIWMQIDYDFLDVLIKRGERVYKALEERAPPPRTENFKVCNQCPFKTVCLPNIVYESNLENLDDFELSGMLERRESLKESHDEFIDIDETIKDIVKARGAGEKTCGDFLIKVQEVTSTKKVPITWEEQKTSYLKTQIIKMTKGGEK